MLYNTEISKTIFVCTAQINIVCLNGHSPGLETTPQTRRNMLLIPLGMVWMENITKAYINKAEDKVGEISILGIVAKRKTKRKKEIAAWCHRSRKSSGVKGSEPVRQAVSHQSPESSERRPPSSLQTHKSLSEMLHGLLCDPIWKNKKELGDTITKADSAHSAPAQSSWTAKRQTHPCPHCQDYNGVCVCGQFTVYPERFCILWLQR